jgi:hypothetical protein
MNLAILFLRRGSGSGRLWGTSLDAGREGCFADGIIEWVFLHATHQGLIACLKACKMVMETCQEKMEGEDRRQGRGKEKAWEVSF